MKKNLRIGILLANDLVPAWAYEMLSTIRNASGSEIVLKIRHEENVKKDRGHYIYDLYTKLDRKYFKSNLDAFELKSVASLLKIDTLAIKDIQKIKEFDLDILIQLNFKELPEEILKSSRYGVWHYHFGDTKKNRRYTRSFLGGY